MFFLCCSTMGMEVRDSCTDKEPDGVIKYSSGASPILSHESAPTHHDDLESVEHDNVVAKSFPVHEDCDVKECNTDNSADNSEACQAEEHNCPAMTVHNGHLQEKSRAQSVKSKGELRAKVSPKIASKPCSTNGRANCTVPQPFALATEKRASTRPLEAETDANKLFLKSKTTQPFSSGKKNQVFFFIILHLSPFVFSSHCFLLPHLLDVFFFFTLDEGLANCYVFL